MNGRASRVEGRGTAGRRLLSGAAALVVLSAHVLTAQRAGLVPPVLHHLTIVLDSATWRDVRVSSLFRGQFAGRDTSILDDCRSLYGKFNYVTLCRPGRLSTSRKMD